MIAKLLQRPAAAEATASPRDQLRQVQAHAGLARNAAARADEASERAKAACARARQATAAFGDVDSDVVRFRAGEVRAGGTGAGPLPNEMVVRRAKQHAAAEAEGDAERTGVLLEREAAAARAAVVEAESELRLAVDRVLQSEAAGLVARLRERERAAAADRGLLAAFLAGRTFDDRAVDWSVQSVAFEPIHPHLLDVASAGRLPAGDPVWRSLRARLTTDATATLGDGVTSRWRLGRRSSPASWGRPTCLASRLRRRCGRRGGWRGWSTAIPPLIRAWWAPLLSRSTG